MRMHGVWAAKDSFVCDQCLKCSDLRAEIKGKSTHRLTYISKTWCAPQHKGRCRPRRASHLKVFAQIDATYRGIVNDRIGYAASEYFALIDDVGPVTDT